MLPALLVDSLGILMKLEPGYKLPNILYRRCLKKARIIAYMHKSLISLVVRLVECTRAASCMQ